jgi:hypothetical protein
MNVIYSHSNIAHVRLCTLHLGYIWRNVRKVKYFSFIDRDPRKQWVYPFLDWNSKLATGFYLGILFFFVIVFVGAWALHLLRDFVGRKLKRRRKSNKEKSDENSGKTKPDNTVELGQVGKPHPPVLNLGNDVNMDEGGDSDVLQLDDTVEETSDSLPETPREKAMASVNPSGAQMIQHQIDDNRASSTYNSKTSDSDSE